MTHRALIWATGIGGSGLAHVAILAGLLVATRPDPVVQQQMPTSELDVRAYKLDRAKAAERSPDQQTVNPIDPDSTEMSAGAVPQTRAQPVDAQVSKADNRAATAMKPVRASTPRTPLRPPSQVVPAQLAAAQTPQPQLKDARPAVDPVSATAPDIVPDLPVSVPVGAAITRVSGDPAELAEEPKQALNLPGSRPDPVTLASAIAAPMVAATLRQRPEHLKAALAFSGGQDGDVDPVSLAAFQSFMRPGDVQLSQDSLRDGVSALLARVPCSRLQVGFDPQTATLRVNGHIPEDSLRGPVLEALQARMGADIVVSDNMLILPRPQCGALSGISNVGLAQSTDQITNPLLIGKDAHAQVLDFVKDDKLFFNLTAPEYDAYVYVDYFDAAGSVLHLAPNDRVPLGLAMADSTIRVGARTAEETGLQILIGPPYGQEIAVAFATSVPLYDGLRPLTEPAVDYLDWLREQVTVARALHPDFKGEWVYFFVTTTDR